MPSEPTSVPFKMVSLINFKLVNEEIQATSQHQHQQLEPTQLRPPSIAAHFSHPAAQNEPQNRSSSPKMPSNGNKPNNEQLANMSINLDDKPNFVVTWRNLRFAIEPKWHQRVLDSTPVAALSKRTSAGALVQAGTETGPTSQPNSKVVLDRLDGSFKSGELTAILGPSGKC